MKSARCLYHSPAIDIIVSLVPDAVVKGRLGDIKQLHVIFHLFLMENSSYLGVPNS